jgi:hypothetical protein
MKCDIDCASTNGEAINRRCACVVVDAGQARNTLATGLSVSGAVDPLMHAFLFSPHALFVDRAALETMGRIAADVFAVARNASYVRHVLRRAPDIARHDPGSAGGVLGLDFHLTVAGPRLIEINTNPGGLLLNAMLLDAVRPCVSSAWAPWTSSTQARVAAVSAWLEDMRQQHGRMPVRLALVDAAPREQFLYPEFELYIQEFRACGVDAVIRAPDELARDAHGLRDAQGPVDAVYNRLTDFALAEPAHAPLAAAYLQRAVALTPHPRAHALFADKRDLAVLGDAHRLEGWGIDAASAGRLAQAIPPTVEVGPQNRDALWAARDQYFFKPASGFGSRGSYRGDKLTRRSWAAITSASYVAQAFAAPSVRMLHDGASQKADVRCFASASGVLLFAARLYQGQTTNMRTPGGGFAAVLTTPAHETVMPASDGAGASGP